MRRKVSYSRRVGYEDKSQWKIIKVCVAIGQITMPNFCFYVADPYRPGRKITVTMRQDRSEVSKAKVGQTFYVCKVRSDDWRLEHLKIQTIVLTAGDPTSEHLSRLLSWA